MNFDILCHCHLRWDSRLQRPHHLMTRMANYRRVFVLEDAAPLPTGETQPRFTVQNPQKNLVVVRPLLPYVGNPEQDADVDRQCKEIFLTLLREELTTQGFQDFVHWFYSPLSYWIAPEVPARGIAYDCMEEPRARKDTPAGLIECESELLNDADIVFTGGRSLFVSKSEHHPNVHLFASGVEIEHFSKATDAETPIPEDIGSIPGPRFTFTGAIDERINFGLLRDVAEAQPDWQLVMIGPVVNMRVDRLPRRPNLHYLGEKPYADLPAYLKGTEVAMMPFVLNDATRYLNPTKMLEYMAARRPIVSTSIADVAAYYDKLVWIADTPGAFVEAGREALQPEQQRLDRCVAAARAQTWDSIASQMNSMLEAAIANKKMCVSA